MPSLPSITSVQAAGKGNRVIDDARGSSRWRQGPLRAAGQQRLPCLFKQVIYGQPLLAQRGVTWQFCTNVAQADESNLHGVAQWWFSKILPHGGCHPVAPSRDAS